MSKGNKIKSCGLNERKKCLLPCCQQGKWAGDRGKVLLMEKKQGIVGSKNCFINQLEVQLGVFLIKCQAITLKNRRKKRKRQKKRNGGRE